MIRPGTLKELLLQPGAGLDTAAFSFFIEPAQSTPLIAVDDIGRAVASVLEGPEQLGGQFVNLAGDAPTGRAIGEALSRAAGYRSLEAERWRIAHLRGMADRSSEAVATRGTEETKASAATP